jgi:hypothetical protein
MERTSRGAVLPVACGWSDVGSWHAVWELSEKDSQGNAAQGAAVFEDSRNCNVLTDKALVAFDPPGLASAVMWPFAAMNGHRRSVRLTAPAPRPLPRSIWQARWLGRGQQTNQPRHHKLYANMPR